MGDKGRVLLIYPRYRYLLASSIEEPVGILYLASALRSAGWDVDVIDLTYEKNLDKVGKAIGEDTLAVGMSVSSPLLDRSIDIMNFIREHSPSIPVIMGGAHASALPESALEAGFDYAVIGEGERALVSLLDGIRNKDVGSVPGLAYRNEAGDILINPPEFIEDLDSLPFPDRSCIDYGKYEKVGFIVTRGCPYGCFYCKPMVDKLFGKKVRTRTPGNVVKEIEEIFSTIGRRIIHFRDDNVLLGGLDWIQEFNLRIKRAIPRGIQFTCNLRVDHAGEEIIKVIKEAGCIQIFFGVESGSQRILDFYRKRTTPEQAVEAFRLCKRYKIESVAAFMLGAPEETREDLELTYQLVKRMNPDNWIVYIATPFPGNYLYDYALERGIIRVTSSEQFDNALNKRNFVMPMELKYLTREDIREYADKIDRYMLLRNAVRWSTISHAIRRPRGAYNKMRNLLRIGN